MQNWDQQYYDLMQVQDAIYTHKPESPNFIFLSVIFFKRPGERTVCRMTLS